MGRMGLISRANAIQIVLSLMILGISAANFYLNYRGVSVADYLRANVVFNGSETGLSLVLANAGERTITVYWFEVFYDDARVLWTDKSILGLSEGESKIQIADIKNVNL